MRSKPTEDEMATIYSAVRYGDNIKAACKMLNISSRQVDFWLKKANRAFNKRRWDEEPNDDEKTCEKLKELIESAKQRRWKS